MTNHNILVVDDEPTVRRVAERMLVAAGYGVCHARDGSEALELLAASRNRIALVLSDIVMPRMSGVELVGHLSIAYPDLPIILMSGYAADQLRARGIAEPCGILAKPFTGESLLEEVRRCLSASTELRP